MHLTTYSDAATFLTQAQPFLEQQETVNSLLLGICLRMREFPEYVATAPYLATVHAADQLVAAAIMTPPHKLVVAAEQPDVAPAFELLAADLRDRTWAPPGVNGPAHLSAAFAALWAAATGQRYRLKTHLRLYELYSVAPPASPPGELRVATAGDQALLAQWLTAFGHEALGDNTTLEESRTTVERGLRHGNYFLWDQAGPVALAGRTRPTRHSVTIGPVYTPPDKRNRGYATALVAQLSQQQLDSGRRSCTLFTDLANPTSNSIYQKIGYQPVCDFDEYQFEAA